MSFLNILVQLVNAGLQIHMATVFYSLFLKPKYFLKILMPAEIAAVLFMTVGLVFYRGEPVAYVFTLLPSLLLTFLFDASVVGRTVCFLIYNIIEISSEMLTASFVTMVFHVSFSGIGETAYIVGMLMSKLITFIFIAIIKACKRNEFSDYYRFIGIKVCIFPFASLLVVIIQYLIIRDDIIRNNKFSFFILASYTVLIIANMIVFDYIDSICMHAADKEKIAVANEIIAGQAAQYNDLIKHNEDIIRIQHDSRHFYMGLISEIEAGRYSSALSQLKKLYEDSSFASAKSGDIIYSAVERMQQKAEEYNTAIDFTYVEPGSIKIPATDLAIILGNALENAVEACACIDAASRKTIQLFVRASSETIIITVKNPVSKKVDVSDITSSKPNAERHGYGIISMKQIAAKYGGDVAFSSTDHVFGISIVLNNNAADIR